MILLLLPAVFAAEPLSELPQRPALSAPVAGECGAAIGLDIGEPVPEELVVDERVTCAAVALPISKAADALALVAWGDALEARYRLDTVYLQGQVRITEAERDWYAARLAEAQRVKFWERPWAQRTIGGISVLAVCGVTAWGLAQIEG